MAANITTNRYENRGMVPLEQQVEYPVAVDESRHPVSDRSTTTTPMAAPTSRPPLDSKSALLRCMSIFCFSIFAGICIFALTTPFWYSNKTSTDTGTVISPFYACTRSPGNIYACSELELDSIAISISSTSCEVDSDKIKLWMYLIRGCVLVSGGSGAIAALILLCNLAIYPISKSALPIAAIVFGVVSVLTYGGSVAVTIIGLSDELTCGEGFCGTEPDCSDFWMSSAWVLFVGGAFPLAAVAVLILDIVKRKILSAHAADKSQPQQQQLQANHEMSVVYSNSNHVAQQQPRTDANGNAAPINYESHQSVVNNNAEPTKTTHQANPVAVVANEPEEAPFTQGPVHPDGFELPEGDWQWDPASSMYWSESQYLFLNPLNSHFYDPNSTQWYNPENEEWYASE